MIRFGSVDLLLEDLDGKVHEWLDRHRPMCDMRLFSRPGGDQFVQRGDSVVYPNWPDVYQGVEFNKLYVPSGASRWSFMACLATREQVESIIAAVGGGVSYTSAEFKIAAGTASSASPDTRYVKIPTAYVLPPQPLSFSIADYRSSRQQVGGIPSLWVVPIVDERYWWQWKHCGEISAESWTTLDDAVTYLTGKLGISPTTIPPGQTATTGDLSAYPEPAVNTSANDYMSAAALLDGITSPLGMLLTPSTREDGYFLASTEASRQFMSWRLQANTLPKLSASGNVGTVQDDPVPVITGGTFRGDRDDTDGGVPPEESYKRPAPQDYKVLFTGGGTRDYPTSDAWGLSGLTRVIRVPVQSVDNDYADAVVEAARDRYRSLHDWVFAGIRQWQLTSLDDVAIYSMRRGPGGQFDCYTRVRSLPHNFTCEIVTGGTPGTEMIRFTIDSADCEADPKSASVNVDAIICSGASVAIDDTVTVYDKAGCLLNEPEADLAGRVGFAVKLDDGVACEWEVLQMCCPTNQCS